MVVSLVAQAENMMSVGENFLFRQATQPKARVCWVRRNAILAIQTSAQHSSVTIV